MKKAMRHVLIVIFLFQVSLLAAQPYFLSDTVDARNIKKEVDLIFDFEFQNTDSVYSDLTQKYPDHPLPDLFYSFQIYWKHFPITPSSNYETMYLSKLKSSIEKGEKMLEISPNNYEVIFFNLLSRMLILQYYADNKLSSKLIPHVRPTYRLVVKGFELTNELVDFNFSTGVYNYYREYYPEAHSVYKPIAFFFPEGNAKKGIKQLKHSWKNGVLLHSESLFFLTYIHLYFEKDFSKGLTYAKQLDKEYPNNPLYITYHLQSLLLMNRYKKADELICRIETLSHQNDYFKIIAGVYRGIICEKRDKNLIKAEKYYLEALLNLKKYGEFANTYSSIAYFGLSRIYQLKDKELSKKYKKAALDLAIYPHINFD